MRIINLIPPCRVFLEPFAGEAHIARNLRPPEEIILVDKVRAPGLVLPEPIRTRTRFVLGDGIGFLDAYKFRGDEFTYCDPPYLLRARAQRGRAYYESELADSEQKRFLRVARAINCRVMISGYASPLYDDALADWNREEFQVMTRGGTMATEVLWFNYPRPTALHDYRYVGENFRERCRLRRKIKRAVADLLSMPALERAAMFAELCAAIGVAQGAAPELARRARGQTADPRAETGADAGAAALARNGAATVPHAPAARVISGVTAGDVSGERLAAALEEAITIHARDCAIGGGIECTGAGVNAGKFTAYGAELYAWVEIVTSAGLAGAVAKPGAASYRLP